MPHFPKAFFKKGRGVWYVEIPNQRWVFQQGEEKSRTAPRVVYLTDLAPEIVRPEPLDRIARLHCLGGKLLEGHDPLHGPAPSLEDLPHASVADLVLDDAVTQHEPLGLALKDESGRVLRQPARLDELPDKQDQLDGGPPIRTGRWAAHGGRLTRGVRIPASLQWAVTCHQIDLRGRR